MALVAVSSSLTASARHASAAGVSEPDTVRWQVPDPVNLLASLKSTHPRLILDLAGMQTIRDLVVRDPTAKAYLGRLVQTGKRLLDQPVSARVLVGPRLLATSRRVLDRVSTLSLLFNLDGDVRWRDRAVAEMRAAASFSDWNPSHFLDVAEMTHALALGYDWLHASIDPLTRDVIANAIIEKGLRLADEAYRQKAWWVTSEANWNAVCNGGLIVGALAVADRERDLAQSIIVRALGGLPSVLASYAPDGGWAEGPAYWEYATGYLAVAISALETALGSDFGLGGFAGLPVTAQYRLNVTGSSGLVFNYADSADRLDVDPVVAWLGHRYADPWVEFESRRLTGSAIHGMNLAWYAPTTGNGKSPSLDRWFRGTDVVCMRSSWTDPNALFCGVKGGDNGASHAHLDLGTFVLDALGQRWAVDLGPDDYNLPDYFGKRRGTYYRIRTEGHNTLVMAGQNQDATARAAVSSYFASMEDARVVIDLTAAYAGTGTSRVRRGVALQDGRSRVLIQDEVSHRGDVDIVWAMHTQADVQLDYASGARIATLTRGNAVMEARILSPADAWFAIEVVAAPSPQKRIDGIRKLTVQIPQAPPETRIAVLLTPLNEIIIPSAVPELLPLDYWGLAADVD